MHLKDFNSAWTENMWERVREFKTLKLRISNNNWISLLIASTHLDALQPPSCPWWKVCELAPCRASIHRIPSAPIDFPVQISCLQLSRFRLESIGFHWFHDSLCRPGKICELAPCCARFKIRRNLFTPIDSIAEISYSFMSHFCADRIKFARISFYQIRIPPSSDSFGVLDLGNPIMMTRDFWNQSIPRYIISFEPGNNNPDENLCIELPGRSMQRHILSRPKWFQVISRPGWMFALPWESRIVSYLIRTNLACVWPSFINSYCPFRSKPLLIITDFCDAGCISQVGAGQITHFCDGDCIMHITNCAGQDIMIHAHVLSTIFAELGDCPHASHWHPCRSAQTMTASAAQ